MHQQHIAPLRRGRVIVILGGLAALGPFTIDMYLPGFKSIAADLHTTIATVGYSLTSYFIGISFGQLIYGPLTDRHGRKRPLMIGLLIYVAAATACALSPSVQWLIGARLAMALGACVGIVASRAVVRDLFPVHEIAEIFSTFMLIIAISPMLAPTIGGYVTANLGWQFIFYILAAIAVIIALLVIFWLPESKTPDPAVSLRPARMGRRYAALFRQRQFLTFAITGGFSLSGLLGFVAGAPYLLMHVFDFSQTQFGWGFAANALGLILGSQVNRRLLKRYSPERITRAGVNAQVFFGGLLAIAALAGYTPIVGVFAVLFLFLFATGVVNPNMAAIAIAPFATEAGSAAALLGFLQMGFGAIASALISVLANGTAVPIMMVIWVSSLGSFVLLRTVGRSLYLRSSEPVVQ